MIFRMINSGIQMQLSVIHSTIRNAVLLFTFNLLMGTTTATSYDPQSTRGGGEEDDNDEESEFIFTVPA